MAKSLLEALPGIVSAGKRQASQILEQLDGPSRVTLQTRELVIPSKDAAQKALSFGEPTRSDVGNRLIYGTTFWRWPRCSLVTTRTRASAARST